MEVRGFAIEDIYIGARHRVADPKKVSELADSISRVGLLNPPTVRIVAEAMLDGEMVENVPALITGHHRVLALKEIGEEYISCHVLTADDVNAGLIEIDENLVRAELSPAEREEFRAERLRLQKKKEELIRHDDEKTTLPRKPGRPKGSTKRTSTSAAASALGITEPTARRAEAASNISDEAKATLTAAGITTQKARLAVAAASKGAPPEKKTEIEVAKAQELASIPKKPRKPKEQKNPFEKAVDHFTKFTKALAPMTKEERQQAVRDAIEALKKLLDD